MALRLKHVTKQGKAIAIAVRVITFFLGLVLIDATWKVSFIEVGVVYMYQGVYGLGCRQTVSVNYFLLHYSLETCKEAIG